MSELVYEGQWITETLKKTEQDEKERTLQVGGEFDRHVISIDDWPGGPDKQQTRKVLNTFRVR